ncbi:unnamed protein product, partial [Ceratitis capitata]
ETTIAKQSLLLRCIASTGVWMLPLLTKGLIVLWQMESLTPPPPPTIKTEINLQIE